MSLEEEGNFDGLTEEDLIDDAEVDTMVREAVSQVGVKIGIANTTALIK